MNKTCRTCGTCVRVCDTLLRCTYAESDTRYYGRLTSPRATACGHYMERANPIEQRCQQLDQLAREMYAAIAPMHVPCCEDTCLILADEGWPADACPQYFRQRLEELGVIVDG